MQVRGVRQRRQIGRRWTEVDDADAAVLGRGVGQDPRVETNADDVMAALGQGLGINVQPCRTDGASYLDPASASTRRGGRADDVEAVLCDLDDTLYPQASWLEGAWRAVAAAGARHSIDEAAFLAALQADAALGSARGGVIDRALAAVGFGASRDSSVGGSAVGAEPSGSAQGESAQGESGAAGAEVRCSVLKHAQAAFGAVSGSSAGAWVGAGAVRRYR
jgi:hypothetical protein